jgi:hypothetical protein
VSWPVAAYATGCVKPRIGHVVSLKSTSGDSEASRGDASWLLEMLFKGGVVE